MNFFRVPFESGEATLRVVTNDTDTSGDAPTGTLESRVREAIGQKDEIIAALTRQLEDLRGLMA